jgi:hypothetical protein
VDGGAELGVARRAIEIGGEIAPELRFDGTTELAPGVSAVGTVELPSLYLGRPHLTILSERSLRLIPRPLWIIGFGLRRFRADRGKINMASESANRHPIQKHMVALCAVSLDSGMPDLDPAARGARFAPESKCCVSVRVVFAHGLQTSSGSKSETLVVDAKGIVKIIVAL